MTQVVQTRGRKSAAVLACALAMSAAVGCKRAQAEVEVMHLERIRPRSASGVFLNEQLVFHFSKDLDRTSVNRRSVRIASLDGRSPRGELVVERDELRFVPAPVLGSAGDDGGYQPGAEYRVTLRGFPHPDGLRATHGAPLAQSFEWSFETVSADAADEGPLYEDSSPEIGWPILVGAKMQVPPTGPIAFEGGEPIDPTSVIADEFQLFPLRSDGALAARIPLRARLLDNRDPRATFAGEGRTWFALYPETVLAPGPYTLHTYPSPSLRDFGGHHVWPYAVRRVHVIVGAGLGGEGVHAFVEAFLDPKQRSTAEVPDADGTARWADVGRVEVRYPMAAGDGSAGDLVLRGAEGRSDVQAVVISLERGSEAELAASPTLVTLRAQKRLTIAGRLTRRASGERPDTSPQGPLSDWLLDARERDLPWTVLIAGGDLTISGRVEVDGPLLLVAGGRIRVSGTIRVGPVDSKGKLTEITASVLTDDRVARQLDAGVLLLAGRTRERDDAFVETALELDRPTHNPLVEPLLVQVISTPIPPAGAVSRWRSGAVVAGFAGAGRYAVKFIGEPRAAGASEIAVDDPALLLDARSLRLLIELEVPPGGPWNPPWVDDVAVFWDEAGGSRH